MGARVVSATNRNLEAEVRAGRFREDLFYRLNVLRIEVPPLRERLEDLPLLCAALLERISERLGFPGVRISADALDLLAALPFPGNIRELENILERGAIYARDGIILPGDIDVRLPEGPRAESADTLRGGERVEPAPASLEDAERAAILAALKRSGGNRTRAAAELGISRRSLLYKIKDYGLR